MMKKNKMDEKTYILIKFFMVDNVSPEIVLIKGNTLEDAKNECVELKKNDPVSDIVSIYEIDQKGIEILNSGKNEDVKIKDTGWYCSQDNELHFSEKRIIEFDL